jgi:hypothetical protein
VVIFAELGVKKFDRLVTPGRCKHPHPTLLHPRPYAGDDAGDDAGITWVATVAADPARIILLALPR